MNKNRFDDSMKFLVTDDLKKNIICRANELNISLSEYIRRVCLLDILRHKKNFYVSNELKSYDVNEVKRSLEFKDIKF